MAVRYVDVDDESGQRLDNFLLRELAGIPRSRVYRLLRKGEARVNGRRAAPDYRLKAGDRVRLPPYAPEPTAAPRDPSPGLIDWLERSILFEDASIIVINKPSGIAVHGGSGISNGVIETLRARAGAHSTLELVHRLDRDTSGCLMLAKRRAALLELHAAFRDGRVDKSYDVLVHGSWPRTTRSVQLKLARYVTRHGERRVRVEGEGKSARTDFSVQERSSSATWLKAYPQTGRTHQIRVHCSASGHPVVGDKKYTNDDHLDAAKSLGIRRLCLHASTLSVPGADGHKHKFAAPPPEDFVAAWRALE